MNICEHRDIDMLYIDILVNELKAVKQRYSRTAKDIIYMKTAIPIFLQVFKLIQKES
jgi:hypothetical protein